MESNRGAFVDEEEKQTATHSLLIQFECCYNKHPQNGRLLLNSILLRGCIVDVSSYFFQSTKEYCYLHK